MQNTLEDITRRWWFFVFIFFLQLLPPFAAKGFSPEQFGLVTGEILSGCYLFAVPFLYPVFKVLPILLAGLIAWKGNRFARLFSLYAGLNYVFIAILQSVGQTENFGFGITFTNLIMFLLVAASWLWESALQGNDFHLQSWNRKMVWVIPLAALSFWYPANASTFQPDFNPVRIITNEAGLTFCMMTPVYLAMLLLFYPRVNIVTLRVTGLVGTIIALYNVSLNFIIHFQQFWWNGILHIPLLVISLTAFILSFKKRLISSE